MTNGMVWVWLAVMAVSAFAEMATMALLLTVSVTLPSIPTRRSALVGTRWGSAYRFARGRTTAATTMDTITNRRREDESGVR